MTQTPINTSLILNHTIFNLQTRPNLNEGLDGGSGIHYSLKI